MKVLESLVFRVDDRTLLRMRLFEGWSSFEEDMRNVGRLWLREVWIA